ncbi:U6 snRNA phosphodiesterase Usb1 [Apodospora peruviana]|uniref:U6 snRNA phosphodiesterase n=1 Tax=Apodospora peruviana TaxID=516989 RepID=A0AAE0IQL5_9PEZI|nr:U6 snRNA phosphodiesterase Usb1 [Apodospora peruviana]
MPLVDYASDSEPESADQSPSAPAPKRAGFNPVVAHGELDQQLRRPALDLPPLPAAFHDLYASTVRASTADDPSLHQGRVRQIPHVAGNWPSHVYIEWHPTAATYTLLTGLLSTLQKKTAGTSEITSFLTSDLGAPLPLHISLSRPMALTTADKDEFLEQLVASIRESNISPFELTVRGVEWHRTDESGRSFLVLRLRSLRNPDPDPDSDSEPRPNSPTSAATSQNKNPELTELLKRCNQTAKMYGQPELYQWADINKNNSVGDENSQQPHNPKSHCRQTKPSVGDAFHISIAWSFSKPTDELKLLTEQVFGDGGNAAVISGNKQQKSDLQQEEHRPASSYKATTRILVDGVKVKVGNVVTHIPLPERGHHRRHGRKRAKHLLGLT